MEEHKNEYLRSIICDNASDYRRLLFESAHDTVLRVLSYTGAKSIDDLDFLSRLEAEGAISERRYDVTEAWYYQQDVKKILNLLAVHMQLSFVRAMLQTSGVTSRFHPDKLEVDQDFVLNEKTIKSIHSVLQPEQQQECLGRFGAVTLHQFLTATRALKHDSRTDSNTLDDEPVTFARLRQLLCGVTDDKQSMAILQQGCNYLARKNKSGKDTLWRIRYIMDESWLLY